MVQKGYVSYSESEYFVSKSVQDPPQKQVVVLSSQIYRRDQSISNLSAGSIALVVKHSWSHLQVSLLEFHTFPDSALCFCVQVEEIVAPNLKTSPHDDYHQSMNLNNHNPMRLRQVLLNPVCFEAEFLQEFLHQEDWSLSRERDGKDGG